jgi:hypothetical protein
VLFDGCQQQCSTFSSRRTSELERRTLALAKDLWLAQCKRYRAIIKIRATAADKEHGSHTLNGLENNHADVVNIAKRSAAALSYCHNKAIAAPQQQEQQQELTW